MSVNIWKSYMCIAVEETNRSDLRSYEHDKTSSWNKAWEKFRPIRDFNPWPLRYRCSALPTELKSWLRAGHHVGSKIPYEPNFFFLGLISTTSFVVFINARIASIRLFNRSPHRWFHLFTVIIHHFENLFGTNMMTSFQLFPYYWLQFENFWSVHHHHLLFALFSQLKKISNSVNSWKARRFRKLPRLWRTTSLTIKNQVKKKCCECAARPIQ